MDLFLENWRDLYPAISAFIAISFSQFIKIPYAFFRLNRIEARRAMMAGGMPSSHAAMVCALTTAIGLQDGWTSSLFCISVVFSTIVLYDAAGIRRAAAKQAELLNQLVEDLFQKGDVAYKRLTELLGHTPLEVFVGACIGIAVAVITYQFV